MDSLKIILLVDNSQKDFSRFLFRVQKKTHRKLYISIKNSDFFTFFIFFYCRNRMAANSNKSYTKIPVPQYSTTTKVLDVIFDRFNLPPPLIEIFTSPSFGKTSVFRGRKGLENVRVVSIGSSLKFSTIR